MGLQAQSTCSASFLSENKWDGSNPSYQQDKINPSILVADQKKKRI